MTDLIDTTEMYLRTILEHDRREPVLEAFEHRVPDVVRDEHRPHGHEHLAAHDHRPAGVDEGLVADEREIADGERCPGIAPAALAHSPRAVRVPAPSADPPAARA